MNNQIILMKSMVLERLKARQSDRTREEHTVQCISKRMTGLFMCAGIIVFIQERTRVLIDFIKREMFNGFHAAQ